MPEQREALRLPRPAPELVREVVRKQGPAPAEREPQLRRARIALSAIGSAADFDALFGGLHDVVDFEAGMLISFTSADIHAIAARCYNVPGSFLDAVMEWQGPPDPSPTLVAAAPAGFTYHLFQVFDERTLRNAPVVEALYPGHGLDLFTDIVLAPRRQRGVTTYRVLTLFHPHRHRYGAETLSNARALAQLHPEIEEAVSRLDVPLCSADDLLNRLLTANNEGCVVVDESGTVVECNRRAAYLCGVYGWSSLQGLADTICRGARAPGFRAIRHPARCSTLMVRCTWMDGGRSGLSGRFALIELIENDLVSVFADDHPLLAKLTDRECECLKTKVERPDLGDKELGAVLGIEHQSARNLLAKIRKKLEVENTRELLAIFSGGSERL